MMEILEQESAKSARGPNLARELRPSSSLRLVSFNIKSSLCAPSKHTERWTTVFMPSGV